MQPRWVGEGRPDNTSRYALGSEDHEIARLDAQAALLELPMPRDVQVRAARILPDGGLLLAGMRDGPLTHTEPAMTNNDGF
jgi:hypothetical protein